MGHTHRRRLYACDGNVYVFKIDPKQEVTNELSYIIMSNMPISMNPQTQEGMGPLDKLLEVIRYKTIVLRGCLGFGILSMSGTIGKDPAMRENLCSLLKRVESKLGCKKEF